jgi:hypothetical protein
VLSPLLQLLQQEHFLILQLLLLEEAVLIYWCWFPTSPRIHTATMRTVAFAALVASAAACYQLSTVDKDLDQSSNC